MCCVCLCDVFVRVCIHVHCVHVLYVLLCLYVCVHVCLCMYTLRVSCVYMCARTGIVCAVCVCWCVSDVCERLCAYLVHVLCCMRICVVCVCVVCECAMHVHICVCACVCIYVVCCVSCTCV